MGERPYVMKDSTENGKKMRGTLRQRALMNPSIPKGSVKGGVIPLCFAHSLARIPQHLKFTPPHWKSLALPLQRSPTSKGYDPKMLAVIPFLFFPSYPCTGDSPCCREKGAGLFLPFCKKIRNFAKHALEGSPPFHPRSMRRGGALPCKGVGGEGHGMDVANRDLKLE